MGGWLNKLLDVFQQKPVHTLPGLAEIWEEAKTVQHAAVVDIFSLEPAQVAAMYASSLVSPYASPVFQSPEPQAPEPWPTEPHHPEPQPPVSQPPELQPPELQPPVSQFPEPQPPAAAVPALEGAQGGWPPVSQMSGRPPDRRRLPRR